MIRLFKVHYPLRALVLLVGEALIVWTSFVLGTMVQNREDSWLLLNVEHGYLKILAVTGVVLLFSYWFDLYDSASIGAKWDQTLRLLLVLGFVALTLAAVGFIYPVVPGNGSALAGLIILTFTLLTWRAAYSWMVRQPFMRERVYVLGTGERALRLVTGLRDRSELGIDVVGWTGDVEGELTRETAASHLLGLTRGKGVHRVIVAMPDRRGTLPVEELLDLRLGGVKVEEATSWLEKISGRIEVEQLYPSWLIFADGFRFSSFFRMVRRALNFSVALTGLVISLPLLPFIVLAVKLDSSGPALYRQQRVGRGGLIFYCYKFRTMRTDAEADTGATWATDDDPRITRVGRFLRSSRLDEIPQLWCVLKGDMHFVGPRPERPEFVEWLSQEIPYYGVRHVVRPGITGWAQVQYKYGNTLEDAREKLQYDLFYIKNASLGLDLLIMFQTIKIVLLGGVRNEGDILGRRGGVFYAYLGYAAWLWIWSRLSPRPVLRGANEPFVSIVMVVRNEESVLPRKLSNLTALDYPPERLEFVVVSDGSSDRTTEILRDAAKDERFQILASSELKGKACRLNEALAVVKGEIAVFMDARQVIERDALRLLLENFADTTVGCVSGELMLGDIASGEAETRMGIYWRVEKKIRALESASGSVVGATGAFYAARCSLLAPIPPETILDDVLLPLQVSRQGARVVFDGRARAWDDPDLGAEKEFRRKVRTLTGNYQLLRIAPWVLSGSNPLRFRFVSHKLLRLAVPFLLAASLVASVAVPQLLYRVVFVLQLAFYALSLFALSNQALSKQSRGPVSRVANAALALIVLNTAAVLAFVNFVTGRKEVWIR